MHLPPPPAGEPEKLAQAPAYALLFAAFALHVTVGTYFQRAYLPFGIAYGQLLFFFGIPWLVVGAMGFSRPRFFALASPKAWAWPWILVAAVAGFLLAGGLNALNQWLVGEELSRLFDSTQVLRGRPFDEQLAVALGVTLLAPIGEEFLFRGYLLRVLRARYGTLAGLLVTSALFAAMHLNPASLVALFGLGLLFGLLRVASGSLLPALLAHALQNGITAAVVLFGEVPSGDPELSPPTALLFVLVTLPAVGFAAAMLRRIAAPESAEPSLGEGAPSLEPGRIRRELVVWIGAALLSGALSLLVLGR